MSKLLVGLTISIHLACLGLLLLSCYPGGINEYWGYFLMLLFVLLYGYSVTIPIAILLIGIGIIWWQNKRQQRKFQQLNVSIQTLTQIYFQQFSIITSRLILITILSIHTNLLQKAVIALSVPIFTADSAKLAQKCNDKQLGLYQIIDCYDDGQGGWYFQTGASFFQTYGFAYQPQVSWNRGLPKQHFTYYPLRGKWKSFEENHDWN
jgi:hypothetical protein